MTKVYVRISEAICRDPECCGGTDYPDGATLSEKIAKEWKKEDYTYVEEFKIDDVFIWKK